jgi:pyrimidine operon attenuation protein/uracil phosphoribosyltransferase
MTVMVGLGFTVTVTVCVDRQPKELVLLTEYVVVIVGLSRMEDVDAPVLQL